MLRIFNYKQPFVIISLNKIYKKSDEYLQTMPLKYVIFAILYDRNNLKCLHSLWFYKYHRSIKFNYNLKDNCYIHDLFYLYHMYQFNLKTKYHKNINYFVFKIPQFKWEGTDSNLQFIREFINSLINWAMFKLTYNNHDSAICKYDLH